MTTKIDVRGIISDHVNTLRVHGKNRLSRWDISIFYLLPLTIAVALVLLNFSIDDTAADILLTSVSIFAGLLLNLLLMIFDALRDSGSEKPAPNARLRKELLKQTYANIAYSILVSLTCALILMCFAIWKTDFTFPGIYWVKQIVSGITYFLLGNFALTLFMVLKRIRSLLNNEFAKKDEGSSTSEEPSGA